MAFPLFHPDNSEQAPLSMSLGTFSEAFPQETELLEFKAGVSNRAIQDAVTAFSNTSGGVILIGIDDAGEIVGKDLTRGIESSLHEIIGNVRNPGPYEISSVEVKEKTIVVMSVARRIEGFAQTSNGRVLVRRGARNVPLFDADLGRFIAERSLQRYESSETPVPLAAAPRVLRDATAKAYGWDMNGARSDEQFVSQGLAADSSPEPILTVAGVLSLVEAPDEILSKAFIEILRFPDGADEYDKRLEIRGPISHQVVAATDAVMEELGSEIVVLGVRRHELPRIPRRVLREAIANAVAHRAYDLTQTAIRIEIRPGSVQVVSPGPLPAPVTEDNIREAMAARNATVIRTLRMFGLAEDAGQGVDVMQDSMMDELLDPPDFTDTGHSVEVVLPVRGGVTPEERAWVREIQDRGAIQPKDRFLLVYAARGEELTNARARQILHVDRFLARKSLQRLRDAGFLEQSGERGGAVYRLGPGLEPPAGLVLDREELKDLIEGMASKGAIKNADVRRETGLDRIATLRLLEELVNEHRLVRKGSKRGSRYELP